LFNKPPKEKKKKIRSLIGIELHTQKLNFNIMYIVHYLTGSYVIKFDNTILIQLFSKIIEFNKFEFKKEKKMNE